MKKQGKRSKKKHLSKKIRYKQDKWRVYKHTGRDNDYEVYKEWGATRICTMAYLVLVYINDLEEGVTSKILKFADDTKLFREIKGNGDKKNLQDDIDKLIKWSEKWQVLFNLKM